MSMVNADSVQLFAMLKKMQDSISSIETTKKSVKMKYEQLGAGWQDKKYNELGVVVRDCNKALNDILVIMLQAEKYVALLAKSLSEYESVQLGSTNGISASTPQTSSFAVTPSSADTTTFESNSRGVYYNAASDMTNPRGAGTTYFHELAHMIDHASCNYRSNLSNTPEFAEALVEDGQRILSLYNNLPVEKQTAFLTRIRQDSAHSFSDLIDATTNGQLHGNYGHSRNYWTRPGNLQAEAFAHFFEASMGDQGKLELLANFFPTAFGIFSSMIDSIRPDNHVRVLSRER